MALVCHRWRNLEHSSRSSFRLRGNVRDLFLPTTFCFPSLTHLDLSHISPWGHPFLHHRNPIIDDHQHLIAFVLLRAFLNVSSLAFYALHARAPLWPALRHARLVRWHQRHSHRTPWRRRPSFSRPSRYFSLLLLGGGRARGPPRFLGRRCIPHSPEPPQRRRLGLRGQRARPHLCRLPQPPPPPGPCIFDPRYIDFVGDDALFAVAANCPGLSLLHLADPSAVSPSAHPQPDAEGFALHDARLTAAGFEALFAALPVLEELALDLCHDARDAGPALEALSQRCHMMKSLKLGAGVLVHPQH